MELLPHNNIEKKKNINIREIMEIGNLAVCFQPIVSVSRKLVIGVEGLIRGVNAISNEYIAPDVLFSAAASENLTLEFDRFCREKVISAFNKINSKDKLLFLNIDASILEEAVGSNYLLNQVRNMNMNPHNIVIEINESKVQGIAALKNFTDTYRKYGFLVALDDVGTGFSNMDRILLVKPDIIKVDISLVKNINNDYYKQGVFKSLVNLCNEIGALVIAEGVETQEEAIQVLRLGGHMIQGFFFARPQEICDESVLFYNKNIVSLSNNFNKYINVQMSEEAFKNKQLTRMTNGLVKTLRGLSDTEFNSTLINIGMEYNEIDCLYILDEFGIQVSNTILCNSDVRNKENLIFYSARLGTDHSMEKYYYPLVNLKLKKYITDPYISLATGNLCKTVSYLFVNKDKGKYILCMDIKIINKDDTLEFGNHIIFPSAILNINGKSISDINKIIDQMSMELFIDSLTDTYNRRFIEERLLIDVYNTTSAKQAVSIILVDIDFFKKVNDTYGHLAGDYVLKEFAKLAKDNIRKNTDWIARYGGEEFLIVMVNADINIAYIVSEKIRKTVENTIFQFKEQNFSITVSCGIYMVQSPKLSIEQIIGIADKHLYSAKSSGRNKTVGKEIND